ncbi:hypothetical protein HK098_006623 [Nowakowskiella sp. JEL0407]|nr:hypothetical protein HK098_006623 [Nowakowskiella sp. JEL0407]
MKLLFDYFPNRLMNKKLKYTSRSDKETRLYEVSGSVETNEILSTGTTTEREEKFPIYATSELVLTDAGTETEIATPICLPLHRNPSMIPFDAAFLKKLDENLTLDENELEMGQELSFEDQFRWSKSQGIAVVDSDEIFYFGADVEDIQHMLDSI